VSEGGDLVIMASDGLFDNVSSEVLCDWMDAVNAANHLESNREDNLSAAILEIAHRLLVNTAAVANHPSADTPFATRARQVGVNFHGGKKDDITVLVGMVVSNEETTPVRNFEDQLGAAEALRRVSITSSSSSDEVDMSD
jgi:serine/threonine protein phosphatase PrpC